MLERIFSVALIIVLLPCASLHAAKDKPYIEELKKLDAVLEQKSIYGQYLMDRVGILRSVLAEQSSPAQRFSVNMRIAKEFMSYSMDSTMHYLSVCRKIAVSEGDAGKVLETDMRTAEEYLLAGYHLEASEIMHGIVPEDVPQEHLYLYYSVMHRLAGELLAYATDGRIRNEVAEQRTFYREKLLGMVERDSYDWYELKREEAVQNWNEDDIRNYSMKMVELSEEGSHEYAIACYMYQEYLDKSLRDEKISWLIKSAVTDVMCAVMDYASLNYIAVYLFEDGDIDRAFSYSADHCMPDAIFFGGKLRLWQVASFFPEIGKSYQAKNDSWQRRMNMMMTVLIVLLLFLAASTVLIYKRQRILVRTRKELAASYEEIEHQNADLVEANKRLSALNSEITESDKIKQEYIALFLSILSENINTTRQYKNHVLRYIRMGNVNEIATEIEALPPIDNDITEFYKMFDRTFLNLYPDFVDKFNALLADGESITVKSEDALTPELRVFALIKLGITDSSRIASLLHYSANTIYNYRAKIKNKARGDRGSFEEAVKMI